MKTDFYKFLSIALLSVLVNSNVLSQSWDKIKPYTLFATDKNGSVLTVKVGIGTSNPISPLTVKGQIIADSLQCTRGPLKVGITGLITLYDGTSLNPMCDVISTTGTGGLIALMNETAPYTFDPFIKVGIGTQTPFYKLDVFDGDVNVSGPINNHGYRIGGDYVLWHNGDPNNIYVGVDAGNSSSIGTFNTFIGRDAGINTNTASQCTYVGYQAGHNNDVESDETFIGFKAGYHTYSGSSNTFVGSQAGFENLIGLGNVFMGYLAGYDNNDGDYNTIVGNLAGQHNVHGDWNSFYGKHAGFNNQNGNGNVYIGDHSAASSPSFNFNTFIGLNSGEQSIGNLNVFSGKNAGRNNNGMGNVVVGGYSTASHNTTGDGNILIGVNSGETNNGNGNCLIGAQNQGSSNYGDYNTCIGTYSRNTATSGNPLINSNAIGYNCEATSTNTMILGNNNVFVGIGLSGVTPAPQNSLEIDARDQITGLELPYTSGLRFRQLPGVAASLTPVNPGPGVLALNTDGDVIYVPLNVSNLFYECSIANPLSELPYDSWIQLHEHNYVFSGQATSMSLLPKYRVGIGTLCNPDAKLEVFENTSVPISLLPGTIGLKVTNNDYFSIPGTNLVADGMKGIVSIVDNTEPELRNVHIAGLFTASNAETNYGGYFEALGYSPAASVNYGLFSTASGNAVNYGGYFSSSNSTSTSNNYGIYSEAHGGSQLFTNIYGIKTIAFGPGLVPFVNRYGIWAQVNNNLGWAGFFVGNVYTTQQYLPSDSKLKENAVKINNSLNIISQLQPHAFNYDTVNYSFLNLPTGKQFGLYADEANSIVPELVTNVVFPEQTDSAGNVISPEVNYKGLNYIGLIPITIQAIKELDSISTGLATRLDTLHTGIGTCSQPTVLTGSSAISLNNHNLYFTNDSSSTDVNNIAVGKSCNDVLLAKLDILQNTSEPSKHGIYILNHSSGFINTVPASGIATMVDGTSSDMSSFNAGGFFQAKNAILNCGVLAEAVYPTAGQNSGVISVAQNSSAKNVGFLSITGGGTYAYGYKADISNATNNFGFGADVSGGDYTCGLRTNVSNGTLMNYGLYASAPPSNAAGYPHNAAGYFEGDIAYTGAIYKASDILLKENIAPLTDAMSIISQLQPKTFNFKTTEYPYLNLPSGKKYGLIAQDVETVIPEVVTNNLHPEEIDSAGNIVSPELSYKSINYEEFIPIMITGMKEQQAVIDSLKEQLNTLQSLLGTNQKSNSGNENNTQYVELENVNAIILNQNDPNPFAEETNITYYIPDNITDAQLMFYDNNGKIIKTVEITGKGNGTLHVYASNLSSGIYTYALVADGKIIDTKKMVCQKK